MESQIVSMFQGNVPNSLICPMGRFTLIRFKYPIGRTSWKPSTCEKERSLIVKPCKGRSVYRDTEAPSCQPWFDEVANVLHSVGKACTFVMLSLSLSLPRSSSRSLHLVTFGFNDAHLTTNDPTHPQKQTCHLSKPTQQCPSLLHLLSCPGSLRMLKFL